MQVKRWNISVFYSAAPLFHIQTLTEAADDHLEGLQADQPWCMSREEAETQKNL